MYYVLFIYVLFQVWDKSDSGEWLCTASWKVSDVFSILLNKLNMQVMIVVLYDMIVLMCVCMRVCVISDSQWLGVACDVGSPGVRSGFSVLFL